MKPETQCAKSPKKNSLKEYVSVNSALKIQKIHSYRLFFRRFCSLGSYYVYHWLWIVLSFSNLSSQVSQHFLPKYTCLKKPGKVCHKSQLIVAWNHYIKGVSRILLVYASWYILKKFHIQIPGPKYKYNNI